MDHNGMEYMTEALDVIYGLSTKPDHNAAQIIRELSRSVTSVRHLARLLHVVGHVAISQLVYLDTIDEHCKKSKKDKRVEDEMAMITGDKEDMNDVIRHVRENELLVSGLLGTFVPVLRDAINHHNAHLQVVAANTLAKFAVISSMACRQFLPSLNALCEHPNPKIRSNIVIIIGDIIQTYGQLLSNSDESDCSDVLFKRLLDPDTQVCRHALMVITHLTLTGMIKVRGASVAALTMCLSSKDVRLADLARLFFAELAGKDANAIYNILPDIISVDSLIGFGQGDFETAIKYVLGFIKKEKQLEAFVEKACGRFKTGIHPASTSFDILLDTITMDK